MKSDKKEENFIEKEYRKGNIKDVSEAFKKYPVKEEWHEGKIENVLKEVKAIYGPYTVGDIVFVPNFTYPNGKKGENHFFVIIAQNVVNGINNIAVPIENIGMLISSKIEKAKYAQNKLVKKDNKNGLIYDSIVKTDEIYNIQNTQILFKIGSIDLDTIEYYKS